LVFVRPEALAYAEFI